ncbi:MAG: hypothetical protein WCQ57_04035, partial [Verrucomicrobiota bacterium]
MVAILMLTPKPWDFDFSTAKKIRLQDYVRVYSWWAGLFNLLPLTALLITAQELAAANVWRASREVGACTNSTDIRQGEPQQLVGRRLTLDQRRRVEQAGRRVFAAVDRAPA